MKVEINKTEYRKNIEAAKTFYWEDVKNTKSLFASDRSNNERVCCIQRMAFISLLWKKPIVYTKL